MRLWVQRKLKGKLKKSEKEKHIEKKIILTTI